MEKVAATIFWFAVADKNDRNAENGESCPYYF